MIDWKILIEKLLKYAVKFLDLNQRDVVYFRNLLLREFKLDEPAEEVCELDFIEALDVPDILVQDVEKYAVENNLCQEGFENLYSTYIFGLLSPLPSEVNRKFMQLTHTAEKATVITPTDETIPASTAVLPSIIEPTIPTASPTERGIRTPTSRSISKSSNIATTSQKNESGISFLESAIRP